MTDWESDKTVVLLNPRLQEEEKRTYTTLLSKELPGHFWLATSGTSGSLKFVALSKKAILTSARGVNQFLNSDAKDVWLKVLPGFHVAGLGIEARAHLSGAQVIEMAWSGVIPEKITLAALVPAQLYDLVIKKVSPPASLRALIIGGGALSDTLCNEAKELGWPVMPSYGLTECASQVATSGLVLPHVTVTIDEGFISLKSDALLTAYGKISDNHLEISDPKRDGWFRTEDRGILEGNYLKVLGRSSDFIKIGGESVDLSHLRAIFDQIRLELGITDDMALLPREDARLGKVIGLLHTAPCQSLVALYNERVLPFARIRQTHLVKSIPRTALGKIY